MPTYEFQRTMTEDDYIQRRLKKYITKLQKELRDMYAPKPKRKKRKKVVSK